MEELFLAIQQRLADNIAALSLIDEDTGQLTADEDGYPVTFPCLLIGNAEVTWSNTGINNRIQQGEGSVTIKLAIDCYDDTHYSSGTAHKIKERAELNTKVYTLLQGCKSGSFPLNRRRSTDYTLPGQIKVYETTFKFTVLDKTATL